MEKRDITGVSGFFDDYEKRAAPRKSQPVTAGKAKQPERSKVRDKPAVRARVGRPPGVTSGSRTDKTKATMHINEDLMNFYRDWSWEERCNLGVLIERAMVAYKEMREKSSSAASETNH